MRTELRIHRQSRSGEQWQRVHGPGLTCKGTKLAAGATSPTCRINDELHLWSCTTKPMRPAIGTRGEWDLVPTHDFAYDVHDPIEVDSGTKDVVYVLR
ncbi:MAG: hypothetical protein AAGJ40_17555 [Planctomycetota bacterium]